ncbi:FadR/GntR family transcriptional regulator [Membranihabitans maritimus]|uniref:FadR/GntR family transcriptional regulator n=1 Tax=Membranihabitans maritimus TaxID=2904244 RepID=UPI001F3F1CDE|nr:FadR/GntR family transcriptional regulator [Membranihabitans maritimus]
MSNFVKRQSLAQKVAIKLQEQISLGSYQAGDKLPTEPDLMNHFGVGRSTIREAVRILSHSGLVEVKQGVGTFINEVEEGAEPLMQRLNRAHIDEIEEVRKMLDVKVAEKAAICRTDKDILRIEKFLSLRMKMANKGDLNSCVDADVNYHISIAEASKNSVLSDLYKILSKRMRTAYSRAYPNTDIYIKTQDVHEDLFRAIKDKDPERAREAAAGIISHT